MKIHLNYGKNPSEVIGSTKDGATIKEKAEVGNIDKGVTTGISKVEEKSSSLEEATCYLPRSKKNNFFS